MDFELIINGVKGSFIPTVCGEIELCSERWGAGYLKFSVLKEGSIDFKEGNSVRLKANGKDMFLGYVFSKSRTKLGIISVTCYDQMRYLKNKDCYTFSGMTASMIFKNIANDYKIKVGDVEDTKYVLPDRIEDNTTLIDIMYKALIETKNSGNGEFIIYDDFGRLCLKNTKYMNSNLLVDKESVLDFDYRTTIDKGVYNKVKLVYKKDTKYTHVLNVFNAEDNEAVEKWGVLQYFSHVDINKFDGDARAKALLDIYKTKNRTLKIITFGNVNIRAGWNVNVNLDIGDFVIDSPMKINRCCHIFNGSSYNMELTMEGGVLDE